MSIFNLFSSKEVDAFARELAGEILRLRPPATEANKNHPGVSARNFEVKLDAMLARTYDFGQRHKLGIYKRARLANTFRWELKEFGYDTAFIEACTQKLVIAVTSKK